MKKYLILYKIIFLSLPAFAQMNISPGARLVTNGAVTINLKDMDMFNNGTFTAGTGRMIFSGDANSNLGGNASTILNELEIAKTGSSLLLQSNITVNNKINFVSGLLNLNQKNISLGTDAFLNNESETSRIESINGGEITISMSMNKPNGVNAGNLGIILTSNSNLGNVVIKRGHSSQTGNGLNSSVLRYYNIQPSGKKIKPTTIRAKYFDAELNAQIENDLMLYQSLDNGNNWTNQSFNSRNVTENWVEKTGMTTFNLLTLSSNAAPQLISKNKGEYELKTDNLNAKKIMVGPNPNNGNFWFKVSGIDKETIATLYTIDGKILRQFRIADLQQQQVNGLGNGIYLLKVPGLDAFKIIVQGSNGRSINTQSNSSSLLKN